MNQSKREEKKTAAVSGKSRETRERQLGFIPDWLKKQPLYVDWSENFVRDFGPRYKYNQSRKRTVFYSQLKAVL